MDYFKTIWSTIAPIGWYIITIAICLWYASIYIKDKYLNWKLKKDEQDYAARYHKNSDLLQERLSALEASRQKMQEKYRQKCLLVQQEGAEQKQRIKQISILTADNSLGHRLGNKDNDEFSVTKDKSKSMREEYNPLMGDGSRGYRPPRRTCCGKGSCG